MVWNLIEFWNSDQSLNRNIFAPFTHYKSPDMIWSWNSHRGYSLINKIGQRFQVLLTLQIFYFFFSLDYDFKLSTFLWNCIFFWRIFENTFSIYRNYCRLFRKFCFCICPLSFIQRSKILLITETIRMCACANNYWKCVNNKCLRVFMS